MALALMGRGDWEAKKWFMRGVFEAAKNCKQRGVATLAYDEVMVPNEPVDGMHNIMFVHGLLGSGRNWRSFAKRLASGALEQCSPDFPGYRMILVDLRNHGNSASLEGFMPPHDIPAAAKDIAELIKAKSWSSPEMVISHSMGGKVALEFGQKSAAGEYGGVVPPKQLVLLDSVPGKIPRRDSQHEVEQVLSTIQSLPDPVPSRRWLVDHMIKLGFSKSLADWLASNLTRVQSSKEEMTWIFNHKEAHEMYLSFCNLDYWPTLESPPKGLDITVVRASRSDRWPSDVVSKLQMLSKTTAEKPTGQIFYNILENSGHWLHADNPEGLVKILVPHLLRLSAQE